MLRRLLTRGRTAVTQLHATLFYPFLCSGASSFKVVLQYLGGAPKRALQQAEAGLRPGTLLSIT